MKLLGLILMFVFSCAMGICFAKTQRNISSNSKNLLNSMIKARRILKYSKPDKIKLMNEIGYSDFLNQFKGSLLDLEMYTVTKLYFDEMGSRDFNSEVESLNYTISILENRYIDVEKTCSQNQKLYISLGIIVGLLFLIVFI